MRTGLICLAVFLTAAAANAGSYGMTGTYTADDHRAVILQCRKDLGYGAAQIRITTGFEKASGAGAVPRVLPAGYITPVAAAEINACAQSRLAAHHVRPAPVAVIRRTAPVAPVAYGCPPDAPFLYRGTLYCPQN